MCWPLPYSEDLIHIRKYVCNTKDENGEGSLVDGEGRRGRPWKITPHETLTTLLGEDRRKAGVQVGAGQLQWSPDGR